MRTILLLCLSILFLPLTLAAEGLTVTGGTLDTDYSYKDNVYTVLTGTKLTFSGTTTADRIVIAEGVTADITLDKINIDNTSENTIKLKEGSTLTLTLSQENKLAGGSDKAGINIPANTELIIQGEGTLNVTGGRNNTGGGAGIGADKGGSTGSIIIKNGTIKSEALGGGGAGIGLGGWGGTEGSLTVEGGDLTIRGKGDEGSFAVSSINITGGKFTNCTIPNIIKFDETNCTFTDCILTFKTPMTLTKDYSGCKLNGDITIASGKYTNCELNNKITVKDGSFTSCKFNGDIILYKGSSDSYTTMDGQKCTIYDGDWTFQPDNYIPAIHSANVFIYGGTVSASGGRGCAGIGGNDTQSGHLVTIYGGYVKAGGHYGAGIGGGDGYSWGGNGGTTIIYGGTIEVNSAGGDYGIGGGRNSNNHGITKIYGGTIKGSIGGQPTNGEGSNVYKGILSNIENVTAVSVDNKPYYIDKNHSGNDNKLYLYMTGADHTVAVRTSENKIVTYTATYTSGSVENNGNSNGYFTFSEGTEITPNKESVIAFEAENITTAYNKEDNALEVKLTITITEQTITTRSAAMNSVQLALSDGTTTYYSDRQTVTDSGEYTFTFDTKGLGVGEYTLTANYGGSTASKVATEQTTKLTIEQAEGSKASDYKEPTDLKATYGQTLADVTLPAGWAWNAPETSVGNVSSSPSSFAATFTPADTKNYKTVSKNLPVTVNKAKASDPGTPAVLSPSPITYGAKLSDITITNGWEWVDETIVPTVSNSGYQVSFSITDYTNYDWSKINGYDSNTHRVIRTVSVTVSRADLKADNFTFAAPTDLVYDGQEKAATVTANDGLTGIGTITVKYYKEGATEPSDPVDAGTYTVKIDVAQGDNYNAVTDLTATDWMFTIIPKSYTVAIASPIANGTVSADKTQAIEGETVTLTVTPAAGYERETLSYTTDDGRTEAITGTTFVMPADNVTVTATFKAASVPPVDPPVNPPVDPDPDEPAPVHYTVTLPAIEGATTDPAAGSYEVESWGSFSFLLTLDEGYRTDSHPVVTARGETLTPNASTGKYTIQHVRSDITVEITGIVKDVATGNETLSDGFHITTSGRLLLVTVPRATRLYLTDTSGRLILSRLLPAGDTRIDDLAAGVYLLTLEGEKTKKIIIR